MTGITHLKIGTKLGLSFGAILVIISLIMVVSIQELEKIGTKSTRVTELRAPTAQDSTQVETAVYEAQAALRGWMLLGHKKFKEERQKAWAQIKESKQVLDRLSKSWTNPQNKVRLEKVGALLRDFEKYQNEIEDMAQKKENIPAVQMLLTEAAPRAKIIIEKITVMIEVEKKERVSPERKDIFSSMADFSGTMGLSLANIRAFLISADIDFYNKFKRTWRLNEESFHELVRVRKQLTSKQRQAFQVLEKTEMNSFP